MGCLITEKTKLKVDQKVTQYCGLVQAQIFRISPKRKRITVKYLNGRIHSMDFNFFRTNFGLGWPGEK